MIFLVPLLMFMLIIILFVNWVFVTICESNSSSNFKIFEDDNIIMNSHSNRDFDYNGVALMIHFMWIQILMEIPFDGILMNFDG